MRLEVNFLHFLTLLGVKIWKIVHMICVESEFDDFAKGSGQMKVIGKIIILLSFTQLTHTKKDHIDLIHQHFQL